MAADVRGLTGDSFLMQGIFLKDEAVKTEEAAKTEEAPKTGDAFRIGEMETNAEAAWSEGSPLHSRTLIFFQTDQKMAGLVLSTRPCFYLPTEESSYR